MGLPVRPVLRPLHVVFGEARELMPRVVSDLLGRFVDYGPYGVLLSRSPTPLLGPSMVNDACPVLSALRARLGGSIIPRPYEDAIAGIAFGEAVHEAYLTRLVEWNPGWVVQVGTHYEVVMDGLDIGFSPDALLGRGGEWHVVEVKSGRPRQSHLVQLALYWLLLRDYYDLGGAWLVSQGGILNIGPEDLAAYARQGLDYLRAVKEVLDSWSGDRPGVVIRGRCPCTFANACPVYRGLVQYLEAPR